MQRIYEAANNVEAHMIVHMLNEAGLQAHIQGEHLQSGAGDLPLGGLVAVAVADEDVTAATRLIRDWEARTASPVDAAQMRAASRAFYGPLVTFVVGGLVGAGVVWSLHHGREIADGTDWNDDGVLDERAYYDRGVLKRNEHDRNFDDKVDAIERYDLQGRIRRRESDDDFDGRLESVTTYRDGQPVETRIDANGDGSTDYRVAFKRGVADVYEYFNSAGAIVKRIHYRGFKTDRTQLDLDANGTWERSYRFDRYDEPVDVTTSD